MSTRHWIVFALSLLILTNNVFAQDRHGAGLLIDDEAYDQAPIELPLFREYGGSKLAERASLKKYSPEPKDQGSLNNCVGWSTAYYARTILLAQERGWTRADLVDRHAFSPGFTYKLISRDNDCSSPTSIEDALRSMRSHGAVLLKDFDFACVNRIPRNILQKARNYTIANYSRLFYLGDDKSLKVHSVKKALAEGRPVVIGMKCPPSFEHADGQTVWNPRERPSTPNQFGHAMCVIGYDNQKYGGAFEIQNSWGKGWGNGGYIWIRYRDFANFVKYGYVLIGASNPGHIDLGEEQKLITENENRPRRPRFRPLKRPSPTSDFAGNIRMELDNGRKMEASLYGNLYRSKQAYSSGTKFRVYAAANRPAYMYVLGADPNGESYLLYPPNGDAGRPAAKEQLFIPSLEFDDQIGREYLCVIYSKVPLNPEILLRKIQQANGSFPQQIHDGLANDLMDIRQLEYGRNDISFSAERGSGTAVALIVETKHID
ncbi:MAG: C1 family peptidase [Bacteroidota bacterium]